MLNILCSCCCIEAVLTCVIVVKDSKNVGTAWVQICNMPVASHSTDSPPRARCFSRGSLVARNFKFRQIGNTQKMNSFSQRNNFPLCCWHHLKLSWASAERASVRSASSMFERALSRYEYCMKSTLKRQICRVKCLCTVSSCHNLNPTPALSLETLFHTHTH